MALLCGCRNTDNNYSPWVRPWASQSMSEEVKAGMQREGGKLDHFFSLKSTRNLYFSTMKRRNDIGEATTVSNIIKEENLLILVLKLWNSKKNIANDYILCHLKAFLKKQFLGLFFFFYFYGFFKGSGYMNLNFNFLMFKEIILINRIYSNAKRNWKIKQNLIANNLCAQRKWQIIFWACFLPVWYMYILCYYLNTNCWLCLCILTFMLSFTNIVNYFYKIFFYFPHF